MEGFKGETQSDFYLQKVLFQASAWRAISVGLSVGCSLKPGAELGPMSSSGPHLRFQAGNPWFREGDWLALSHTAG
jgi:hypothetical protein